ncbi:MAG: ATP-binding protein [Hyphomicrobiales bacterium]|nr:ATP-binding protein [Hyphomicrobiales bacterium]
MPRLAAFAPRRIAMQLALVAGASAILIQVIVAASFFLLRPTEGEHFVHVDALVRLLADLPAGEIRRARFEEIRHAFPELPLTLRDAPPKDAVPVAGGHPFGPFIDLVEQKVEEVRSIPTGDRSKGPQFVFGLSGGEWLQLGTLFPGGGAPPPPYALPLVAAITFAGVSSLLLALWAAHALVRPLRSLAAAAREFDIEADLRPLPDAGPEEVRVASRAFDGMRRRIRDLVEDRTRMLAAMGHDLRTPITRLRLRSEFVADDALRTEFLRDLGMMNDMVEGALSYLREGRDSEKVVLTDLAALVGTICDGAVDCGGDVVYEGPNHLARRVRPQALTRALTNVVDNAMKYGNVVRVRLTPIEAGVAIEVEDDGPGIAASDRERMLRPFERGDTSRNLDDAPGFGLGLAIAHTVVEGHGGRMELGVASLGGLRVRIELVDAPRV